MDKEKKQEKEIAAETEKQVQNPCPICGQELNRRGQCMRCGYCYT